MIKKIINITIIFIIIQGIFLFCNLCEANNETVSFSVTNNKGKVGEEVSIEINLNNDSKFASANLVLNYNTQDLEYVSHAEGDVLKTGAMNIVKNSSETGKIAIGYIGNPSNTEATIKSGNILSVVFKIKSNLEEETNIELECTSLKNDAGDDIISVITNGKIEKDTANDSTENEGDDSTENEGDDLTENEGNDSTENEGNDSTENEDDDSTENEGNDSTGNKDNNTNNNLEAENKFPHAGLSQKVQFIIICLILISISIILYKKNEFMKEIK